MFDIFVYICIRNHTANVTDYLRKCGKVNKGRQLKRKKKMETKNFFSEMKAVAGEFSKREWLAIVAGVVTFVIVCGL